MEALEAGGETLSPTERAHYAEHGFVVSEGFFEPAELEAWK